MWQSGPSCVVGLRKYRLKTNDVEALSHGKHYFTYLKLYTIFHAA